MSTWPRGPRSLQWLRKELSEFRGGSCRRGASSELRYVTLTRVPDQAAFGGLAARKGTSPAPPAGLPARVDEAGWGSPERSIRGSDGGPTVRERDGGDRADCSPRRGRREILGGPRPRTTEGSSRERCGAKGIPSLASQKASGAIGSEHEERR